MSTFTADITWTLKDGEDLARGRYSRGHTVSFDGGVTLPGSASPHVVGKWAVVDAVDPEEMLTAALSSCHMLSFLHVARLAGFSVTAYRDHAEGVLGEIAPRATGGYASDSTPRDRMVWSSTRRGPPRSASPSSPRGVFHCEFGRNRGRRSLNRRSLTPTLKPSQRAAVSATHGKG